MADAKFCKLSDLSPFILLRNHSKSADLQYSSYIQYLLSWNNPRDSGIAYGSIVAGIILIRCLDVLRYAFKLTYLTLAVTVAAEILGKLTIGNGLTSQLRPRKYWTLSKDTVDSMASDLHEFLNVIATEFQKVVYVENVYASSAALVAAFLSYYLVKVVPYWALAIVATTVTFFGPLVYHQNQEIIDEQLDKISELISDKTQEVRKLANQHTAQVGDLAKQYVGDYSAKAQSILRGRVEKVKIDESDFPAAPTGEFKKEEPIAKQEIEVPSTLTAE